MIDLRATRLRFGFVMEQTLGHITHCKNLRSAIARDDTVQATWFTLAYGPRSGLETLPLLRSNWSVRASLRAHRMLAVNPQARFDALFFHTQVTTLLSAATMRLVPTVISLDATPHNYDAVGGAYGHRRGSSMVEAFKDMANRRSLHAARACVTWCHWARESLISDYGIAAERISVIAPGVDLAGWPRPASKPEGRPVQLLFVGGDFTRKGGETLLHAFQTSLRESCELHLVTKAPVREGAGVRVYRDLAPNSDVLKRLYAEADIFVLPTEADCFPLVLQEAMAAGLPIVSTRVGAVAEAVHDGESGVLVPARDPGSLAEAISALAADPSSRQRMGARGRSLAEQHFDSAANGRRIVDLMSRVASECHERAV